jgi:hypothetical protein
MSKIPSPEVLARRGRRLRDAFGLLDVTLGDPPPGRSALDAIRARPAPAPTPPFTISAANRDKFADRAAGRSVQKIAEKAERVRDLNPGVRKRRSVGPQPCRGTPAGPDFLERMRSVLLELEGRTAVDAALELSARGFPTPGGNRTWHCKQVRRLRLRLEAQAAPDVRTAAVHAPERVSAPRAALRAPAPAQ